MSKLRGGGCGMSATKVMPVTNILSPNWKALTIIPNDFKMKIRSNVDKIMSLTENADTVLNSIQYFFYNEVMFQYLIENQLQAGQYVDLLQTCISDLLTTSARMLKSNGLHCNLILQVTGWMSKVLFWFYTSNEERKRKIKVEERKEFLTQITKIEQQLEIEKTIHETSIKYEVYCIKMIFTIFPNDSAEGKELALQFIKGAIESFVTMSPSADLIGSLAGGVNMAINEGYKLYAKSQYNKIFQIEKLRWEIITAITQNEKISVNKILKQLGDMYKKIVSSSWEIHYAWIKSISSIICAKPIFSMREIPLNDEQLKQLQSQRAIIMLDKQVFQISLNVQKLLSVESQELYRRLPTLKNLSNMQSQLLNGNDQIPKFELYSNKLQDAQDQKSKVLTPIQYFTQHFKQCQISQFIRKMEEMAKDLQKLESCDFMKITYEDSLKEQFQEFISIAKEHVTFCLMKMNKSSNFYQQILWVSEQWDQFVTENSDPSLFQRDDFIIRLEATQSELIKISEIFKPDYEIFKVKQQSSHNNSINQNKMEFGIQVHLRQIVCLMKLHQQNLERMLRIEIQVDYLSKILESEQSQPQIIVDVQQNIIHLVADVIRIPNTPIYNLLDMLKLLNSSQIENKQRIFNILPQEVFNLHQIIQYDTSQLKLIELIFDSFNNSYEQFIASAENRSTHILASQILLLKEHIQRLHEQIQNQETFRIRVIELVKSVQFQITKGNNNLDDYLNQMQQLILKTLKVNDNTKQNNVLEYITQCSKLSSDQQIISDNHYAQILDLNPYDIATQKDWDEEKLFIQNITSNLELIAELTKGGFNNSSEYINDILLAIQSQLNSSNQKDQVSKSLQNNESIKTNHEELVKQYEIKFQTLKELLDSSLVEIDKMENDLKTMKRVEQTCINKQLPPDWFKKIQSHGDKSLSQLKTFQLTYLTVPYQIQLKVNQSVTLGLMDSINPTDSTQSTSEKIQSLINADQIRIKEAIITSLFQISESCIKSNVKIEADLMVLRMKTYEIDKKLRNLLNCPDYIKSVTMILQQHWPSQQEKIIQEVKSGLKHLNSLLYELQQVNDADQKKKLKDQYQVRENQIQEQLQNVTEIGSSLGITMLFIRDIKKDLGKIDEKINEIQESMKNMNNDITYLRGKTVQQLLDIRKNEILTNKKMIDASKVYIKIKCSEKQYKKTDNKSTNQGFKGHDDILTKVDEFLDQPKCAMLMHGQAGSGKSTASRKIEEYLWELYDRQSNRECLIVPIVVQLPQLQDPQHLAMYETLKSDAYKFSDNQIRDLKEEIQQKKIKLVIFMDSYDELSEQHRGVNLIRSNKLSMWGKAQSSNYPKVIVTTRSEILTKADYQEWFLPEEDGDPINKYKEIQVEKFDSKQRQEYINQYLNISIKRVLNDGYLLMIKNNNKQEIFDDFSAFWETLKIEQDKSDSDELLNVASIKYLLDELQADKNIQINSLELQRTLQVQLQDLKSRDFYSKTIEMMKIEDILETPFMMEIVVEVLPSLIKSKSQQAYVKRFFVSKYSELLQKQNNEQAELNDHKAEEAWNDLIQNHRFFEDFSITQTETQLKTKLNDAIKDISKDLTKIDNYIKALMSRTLTQYDFYQSFLTLYFQREIGKLKEHGQARSSTLLVQELWRFAKELAVEMSRQTKTQVEYKAQGLIYKENTLSWEDKYFDDSDEKGKYKKMFRDCIPLKQQNNSYCFNHKSLQEFLVAKEFLKQMRDITKIIKSKPNSGDQVQDQISEDLLIKENLMKLRAHFMNQFTWSTGFMKGTCAFVVQKGIRKPELRKIMYAAVELTRKESQMIHLGSNCLFLLANMGECFMDKNTKGIKIKSIDLSGANFAHCNLDDTQFTNVNISGINLFNSSLKNVNWTKMQVSALPPILLKESTKSLLYTKEDRLIISNEQSVQNCSDTTTTLFRTSFAINKMFYFSNQIFTQSDTMIQYIPTKIIPQIINNPFDQVDPDQIANNKSIKRVRCLTDEIYILNDDSDIQTYNITNPDGKTSELITLIFRDALQDLEPNFVIENFWPSEGSIMIATLKHLYQLTLTDKEYTYSVKKIIENTGKCKYFPKYRLLQTEGKIQIIDPTIGDKSQEMMTAQQKKQQKVSVLQRTGTKLFNPVEKQKQTKEQQKELLKQKQLAKAKEAKEKLDSENLLNKDKPLTELSKLSCRVIKLHLDKVFLLWSEGDIEQYHVDGALQQNKQTQLTFTSKFTKKKITKDNKIMVTVHHEKVAIWDLDQLVIVHTLNFRDIKACAIHQNGILTMLQYSTTLIQQDLKSITLSMQLKFRTVCFAQKSLNFVGETIDEQIYFFYNKGEIKPHLIMKGKTKFIILGTLGQRVLIILENSKSEICIWNSLTKQMEPNEYQYAYAQTNIKFRWTGKLYEIFFLKGNQFFRLTKNEATIVSPAESKIVKNNKVLSKNLDFNFQQMHISEDTIYVIIPGRFMEYSLLKGIQQQVKSDPSNISKIIVRKNADIYLVVNKLQIYKKDQTLIYKSKQEIIDCIELEENNDLIIVHQNQIRRLTFESDTIEVETIKIKETKWIANYKQLLFIGLFDRIFVYDLELRNITDSIHILATKKITPYFENKFAILVEDTIHIYDYKNKSLEIDHRYVKCTDISFLNNIFMALNEEGYIYQTVTEIVPSFDLNYKKWNNIQIVIRKNKVYIYGTFDNQIVRQHINTKFPSNKQVIGSLVAEYQYIRGFDVAHEFIVYYTKTMISVKNRDTEVIQKIECKDGCKVISLSADDKFLLTSNLLDKIYLYEVQNPLSVRCIDRYHSINKILFVQNEILINNAGLIHIIRCKDIDNTDNVAYLRNGFKEIGATRVGFNIVNKDSSIDIYSKQKYKDQTSTTKQMSKGRYVRVQVYNPSSDQPINSYQNNCEGAIIKSTNDFTLIELFDKQ